MNMPLYTATISATQESVIAVGRRHCGDGLSTRPQEQMTAFFYHYARARDGCDRGDRSIHEVISPRAQSSLSIARSEEHKKLAYAEGEP